MDTGRVVARLVVAGQFILACLIVSLPRASRGEIEAGPDVPTSAALGEQRVQQAMRTVIDPYRANLEKRGVSADDDEGLKTLLLWVDGFAKSGGVVATEPFLNQAKKAKENGCTDAMHTYALARALQYRQEYDEAVTTMTDAIDRLEGEGYDVTYCATGAGHIRRMLQQLQRGPRDGLLDREVEYLSRTVASGPYMPEEQRVLYGVVASALPELPLEKSQLVIESVDQHLYPWLWHMLSAQHETRLAWKARGGGWAAQVTEEGWKGFETHMVAAREHLLEAWNMNPEWPEAASGMIKVVMAKHGPPGDTERMWFDRAVTAEFDHIEAYEALLWSIMPRWGGSHQQLYNFGRECLETNRFDTQVPSMFVNAFDSIVGDIGSSFDYYKTPGVFEDLQKVADGYLAEPKMQPAHDWYRSFKVAAAIRCERWEEARQFLDAIQGEPDENAFARFQLKSSDVLGEVYARSAEFADETAAAEELAAAGKFDEAKAKFEGLASKSGGRQVVTTYFRGKLKGVEFNDQFEQGEWILLPLDEQLSGWRVKGGKWSVDENGGLVAEPKRDGLRLVYDQKLGGRYELRGKVSLLKRPYSKANAGVYFGQASGTMPHSMLMFFDEDFAGILLRNEMITRNPVKIDESNEFRIERWGNSINAYVNDKRVADAVEIQPEGADENEVLALGGHYWYEGPVLRFEGLEVRKLNQPPEGLAAKEEKGDAADGEDESADASSDADATEDAEASPAGGSESDSSAEAEAKPTFDEAQDAQAGEE
jgi:hypothetical protein